MSKEESKEKSEYAIIIPKDRKSYLFPRGKRSKLYSEDFTTLLDNPFIKKQDFIFFCQGEVPLDTLISNILGVSISQVEEDLTETCLIYSDQKYH